MSLKKIFRPNVAVVVINDQGLILACHRSDRKNVWQLPQGGIDEGETELEALYRELEEEIGTREVEVIGRLSQKIRYEWPEKYYSRGYHGQEQTYFLVRLSGDARIDLSHHSNAIEFDQCAWVTLSDFVSRISSFKKEPYCRALAMLMQEFPNYIMDA
ncbi:MAG: RNA pyrophosphohydrolase [Deltaproteobacteria bacterium]|nr:RNA pyrophosphohydrolase [Deltaproteobacteria bacterium]